VEIVYTECAKLTNCSEGDGMGKRCGSMFRPNVVSGES